MSRAGQEARDPGKSVHTVVVDAHTHIFAPQVVAGRETYRRREPWFQQLYEDPRARIVASEDLLASMTAAGISQSIACGFPWRDLGICQEHNDYLAESARGSAGRLAWLGIVPAHGGPSAAQEAERAFTMGAVGLGELNADAQGFDLSDTAALAPVMEVCSSWNRPVMLHASEPVGHDYAGKGTATPAPLLRFVTSFPELRVVLAHWGGGLPFYELMPEVAAALHRVAYDSAASTYLYRFDVFRAVLDIVGAERVLFASDYPVLKQSTFLSRVRKADIDDDELSWVLAASARRIYGLKSTAEFKV